MYKSISAYIDEIEKRKFAVSASQERIKKLTEEYKREVDLYLENIRRHNCECDAVLKMTVHAELETILEGLAKEWGVARENLTTSFSTCYDFSTSNREFAKHNIKHFNYDKNNSSTILAVQFVVEYNNGANGKFDSFDSSIALNALQKDGKTFGEHITASGKEQINGVMDVVLELDDTKNIVLPFTFRTLIEKGDNGKYEPKNEMAKVVLDAAEAMRTRQNELLTNMKIESEI